jgi:ABC-type sulfate/molybdate transport systems ATPase subunit
MRSIAGCAPPPRSCSSTDYLDRLPKALSGGQRQRVAIGRSICRDPKVFLFDEPLSNLDAALRVATRIEIAKLNESMPETTMIYVTHDQVEAMTLADRIVVLSKGVIEQVGPPMELYDRPAEPVRGPVHRLACNEHHSGHDRKHRRQRHHRLRQWQVGRNRDCRSRRGQGQEGVLRRQAGRPGGDHR